MRKLAKAAALCLLVATMSCGGKGSFNFGQLSTAPGGQNAAPGQSQHSIKVLRADQLSALPDLPETIPPQPADVQRALSEAMSRRPQTADKQASAMEISLTNIALNSTSPGGGGIDYDYEPKNPGLTWVDAQDTSVESEYHIVGRVNSIALEPDSISYASIGIVNWFNYDFAVNQEAQPQYMFNQSLYLIVFRMADDTFILGPNYGILLADLNGRYATGGILVSGAPFDFDIRLLPETLPAPGTGAQVHRCGTAELTVTTGAGAVTIPQTGDPVFEYGDDNWGWRTAAGPEEFDSASGGVTLLGQIYTSGAAVTADINFDAEFWSGPLVTPQPDNSEWFMRGRDRSRRSKSSFNGPQGLGPGVPPGILWQTTPLGSNQDSGPVLGPDGSIYFGAGNFVHGYNPDSSIKPGWPYDAGSSLAFSDAAVGQDGTIYIGTAASGGLDGRLIALNPDGTLRWEYQVNLPGTVDITSAVLEHAGRIYFATADSTTFFTLDAATGGELNSTPLTGTISATAPAVAPDGNTIYVNHGNSLSALNLNGTLKWTFNMPTGNTSGSCPVVAPDGTVFVGSGTRFYAISDLGASGALNTAFGLVGFATGSSPNSSHAINDLGGGSYRIIDRDNFSSRTRCFSETGALLWVTTAATLDLNTVQAIGADGKVYVSSQPNVVRCYDPLTGFVLWERTLGGVGTSIHSSMALAPDGTLYAIKANGILFAVSDLALPINIDCTSLADASFSVHLPDGTPLTGTLDTDTVFDAGSLALSPGDQFYVGFAADTAAAPNDYVLYPARPDDQAGGVITVNAASLSIPPSLAPYFTNPGGTRDLVLALNAYNRVTNDVRELTSAQFTLFDTAAAANFAPLRPAADSAGIRAVLTAGLEYRVVLSNAPYPQAGSSPAHFGAAEVIHPGNFSAGALAVGFGTLAPADAVAGPNNDMTDYYSLAGLTATLQNDAFCRLEVQPGPGMLAMYGLRDMSSASWIVVPGLPFGFEPLANPRNTVALARGTVFTLSDGALFTGNVTVGAGKTLNAAAYPNTLSVPMLIGPGSFDLSPLPTRVWDNPAQPDPGQPGADVTGTGPWQVPVNFLLQYGVQPLTVEVDADYGGTAADSGTGTPTAWNDGAAGRVYALPGSPFAGGGLLSGTLTIPASQGAGTYRFAIRVTDANGAQYTWVWPNLVTLPAPAGSWHLFTADAGGPPGGHGQYSSLTMVNGNPAVTFYDVANADLMFMRALDPAGASWAAPMRLATAGSVGLYTSLAVVDGNPAISYYDLTNGDLKYIRATNATGTAWGAQLVLDTTDDVGQYTSLAVVDGNPAISYWDVTNSDLKYIRATNAAGTAWGTPMALDTANNVGHFTSLAVVDGNPAISYFDQTNTRLKYVRATNATGADVGDWGPRQVVDGTGVAGLYTSLAVVDGNPAISYFEITSGHLKYTRALDGTGTSWGTSLSLDTGGGTKGWYTSLAVVGGNPAISYYDVTNGNLKYIRATNATGATLGDWDTALALDMPGDVGYFTSLTVVSGNPAISYYNNTNQNLKYVRASDASGAGWNTPQIPYANTNVGRWNSLVEVNGHPAVSYSDYDNDAIQYVRADDPFGSSWGTAVAIPGTGGIGLYPSLKLVGGFPAISYSRGGPLRFARATDINGAGWAPSVTVTSLTVTTTANLEIVAGNPAISCFRFNAGNNELIYVRAAAADGSSWGAPQTLGISTGSSATYASFCVVNGNPAVCFRDNGTQTLSYRRATDTTGSAWDVPLVVDAVGNPGRDCVLRVVDGFPAIGYNSIGAPFGLKFIRATDANGTTWGPRVDIVPSGSESHMTIAGGVPVMSYTVGGSLRCVRATAADGSTWGAEEIIGSISGTAVDDTCIAEVAGTLVISLYGGPQQDLIVASYF